MFDKWMNNGIYFVGLFGVYQTVYKSRNLVLLAFSSFEDRTNNLDLPLVGCALHSLNLADDVHAYFDLLIEECLELEDQLGRNALIIYNSLFENAMVKVLRKQEAALTFTEKKTSRIYLEEPMTMKECVAKECKLEESKYMDINLIPPTSNM
ncbi:13967_t:CDS:2, partial [Gigaspora margarita]